MILNLVSRRMDKMYKKIKEDIRFSITPFTLQTTVEVKDLIDLALDIWRLEQRKNKWLIDLQQTQVEGIENSIQKIKKYIEKNDIEIVDYKNQKYNEGFNLEILSIEKDENVKDVIIKETIEPMIMFKGQLVKKAKVILIKNNQ
jgi:hypothetical protein